MEKNIKVKIKNIKLLSKRFKQDLSEFSVKVAVGRLVRDISFIKWDKRRRIYEKSISQYLKVHYAKVIERCVNDFDTTNLERCDKNIIWTMWWQGVDNMPPIVKACHRQLLNESSCAEVIIITKDNFSDYVDLPNVYINKLNEGKISITHLSDVIRTELLKQYGGIWFDSTIFCKRLDKDIFNHRLYTLNGDGLFPNFISRGNFQTFLMGTNEKNSLFFTCLSCLFLEYWKEHDAPIDYLFFDFFICLMCDVVPQIKDLVNACEKNRDFYNLNLHINDNYSEKLLNDIFEKCPLQKLTYKKEFFDRNNGERTVYSYIVEEM